MSEAWTRRYHASSLEACHLDDEIDGTASALFDETLYGIGSRPLVEEHADTRNETFGWAVYSDATWHVTERLNFSSGVRYSSDKKDFRAYIPTDPVNGFNLIIAPTADVPTNQSKTDAGASTSSPSPQ
ncbi:MAG TPA: hypothetical protein VJS42_00445 [Steroidobacteraceae bacterium]|nr:hypothetical protein [Steroidobacteraceae bacterium]